MAQEKQWQARRKHPADAPAIRQLAKDCGISLVQASILDARGYQNKETVDRFLHPSLSDLSDPYALPDMDQAVDRIAQAVEEQERVAVFADYDADGTSAAAILLRYFRKIGLPAGFYVPNRLKEGYGMNIAALEKIISQGITLIITVDNGISSLEEARFLKENGVDLIVTDHHEAHEEIPEAIAVVDAKRCDSQAPFREYCGAGLAYRLVCALEDVFGVVNSLDEYLEMAACATVADLVPLQDDNRLLVSLGLEGLNAGAKNPGLRALIEEAGLETLTASDLSFRIGPMLNAPGRLGQAADTIRLLAGEMSESERVELARAMVAENDRRKEVEREIVEQGIRKVEAEGKQERDVIVLSDSSWHTGVIGIAASKIQEKWFRPVIIAGGEGEILRGSCRSVPGFNIFEALKSCGDLFENFGGHAQAAGFSIRRERMEELDRRLNSYAKENGIEEYLKETCYYDARVKPSDLNEELVEELEVFEPCGIGNPGPNLLISPIRAEDLRTMGAGGDHLSFRAGGVRCVGFGMGERQAELSCEAAAVGRLKINDFQQKKSLQYVLKDFKPSPFYNILDSVMFSRHLSQSESPEEVFDDLIRTFKPQTAAARFDLDRNRLAQVFSLVRKHPVLSTEQFARVPGLTVLGKGAALAILEDEGLIRLKIDSDQIRTEIIPQQEKRDITKNRLFQTAERLDKRKR